MADWLFTRQMYPGDEDAAQGSYGKGVRVDRPTAVLPGLHSCVELCSRGKTHPAGPLDRIRTNREGLWALDSPRDKVRVTNSLMPVAVSYKAPKSVTENLHTHFSCPFSIAHLPV